MKKEQLVKQELLFQYSMRANIKICFDPDVTTGCRKNWIRLIY